MSEKQTYQVVMPKLGLIMTEATLLEWHKRDGEFVQKGEALFSFESDKSVVEIESPASGILHTLVKVGINVPVQTPIARIYLEGSDNQVLSEIKINQTKGLDPVNVISRQPNVKQKIEGIRATPKARKVARAKGINLAIVSGTGPQGMIVVKDLESIPMSEPSVTIKATPVARRMAEDCNIDLKRITGTGPGGRITREDITAAISSLTKEVTPESRPQISIRGSLPLDGLRGLIAERLSASWNERPQVTLHSEVDASELVALRNRNLTHSGKKISINAYFIAAVSRALTEFPAVNSQLTETGLVQFTEINVGLAVDTERGLVVPVLKEVGKLSLLGIDTGLNDLVERTYHNKTLPEDFTGGTFTITNLGAYGIDSFTPIINPPEAAILGLGQIKSKLVAIGELIGIRKMVTLSLSFDHRLIDGAPAARFLQYVCQLVEDPEKLT